jgi:hypothetical protein
MTADAEEADDVRMAELPQSLQLPLKQLGTFVAVQLEVLYSEPHALGSVHCAIHYSVGTLPNAPGFRKIVSALNQVRLIQLGHSALIQIGSIQPPRHLVCVYPCDVMVAVTGLLDFMNLRLYLCPQLLQLLALLLAFLFIFLCSPSLFFLFFSFKSELLISFIQSLLKFVTLNLQIRNALPELLVLFLVSLLWAPSPCLWHLRPLRFLLLLHFLHFLKRLKSMTLAAGSFEVFQVFEESAAEQSQVQQLAAVLMTAFLATCWHSCVPRHTEQQ